MTATELHDPTTVSSVGLAGRGREAVIRDVLTAWDAFLAVAETADLDERTRLKGWRNRDILVHLGAWPGYRALDLLLDSARHDGRTTVPDVDASNAGIIAARGRSSRAEILAALREHRDDIEHYAERGTELDLAPTASIAGRLPLLTVIGGECYELAVHALDLAAAGADDPEPELLRLGVGALTDVTGALAIAAGIDARVNQSTPEGSWSVTADAHGWETEASTGSFAKGSGPVISGSSATILDASAGRNNPVVQLAKRRITVQDLPGVLRLTPILSVAPSLPGGPMLALAAKTLGGASSFLGRRFR